MGLNRGASIRRYTHSYTRRSDASASSYCSWVPAPRFRVDKIRENDVWEATHVCLQPESDLIQSDFHEKALSVKADVAAAVL